VNDLFAVQVQRLEAVGTDVVNPAIQAAYGLFSSRLPASGRYRRSWMPCGGRCRMCRAPIGVVR
jgi:hypothetical protein